jgi:L-ascorbate metabolism protein UlaG (beta-lactamase superfamily)
MKLSSLEIKYLGQCGFLLKTKNSRLVTDPYLSYSVDRDHYCEQTPWIRLYPPPCRLSDARPDIILISHEHDDHLNPETILECISAGQDPTFVIPAPIRYMLTDLGISDSRIIDAHSETPIRIGDFEIVPIPCAHTDFHLDSHGAFFELSYIIKAPDTTVFFGGDMSMYDGICERLSRESIDLLLLPCNGRDDERTSKGIIGNINETEAASLSADLNVPFVAMHHDLYAINACSEEAISSAAASVGAEVIFLKPGL